MADSDHPVTEQVLEPAPFDQQVAAPEHYPFLFSFQGEDVLELTTWNSAAGVTVTIQGRIHVAPQDVKPFTHSHTANTDRSAKTTVATMPRGELLNCIAFVSAGAPLLGQTFVRVAVRRGAGTAFERLGVLIQRPITSTVFAAFPGSVVVSPLEAEPYVRSLTGATPAATAEISETVPTGARWEFLTGRWTLTTSAAGANRKTNYRVTTAAGHVFRSSNPNIQGAGAIFEFTVAPNLSYQYDVSNSLLNIPSPQRAILLAGDAWGTYTPALQAGDQYSAPVYTVLERLEI